MKLIEEWRKAHTFLSVRLSALAIALLGGWVVTPREDQLAVLSLIGLNGPAAIGLIVLVGIIFARVIQQKDPTPPPTPPDKCCPKE